jgi:hypothetical protein
MDESGAFAERRATPLLAGVAYVYVATKIGDTLPIS